MSLKVTSANIRFQNPADGPHDWPFRRELMSEIINDFGPDILGTQEGLQPQLLNLASLLPNYTLVDGHRDWIDVRMYPCIFIKKERIEIIKSGDIWLSETPHIPASKSFDSAFPRLCSWMHAKDLKKNIEFTFVVTHLDHMQRKTRIEQAKVLAQEVKKINGDLPLVILGDFNDAPSSMVQEEISKPLGLKDHWSEQGIPEESSHHKFSGENETGTRIDWVLASQEFQCSEIYFEKKHSENIYPSDHFPLMATLEIK